jgi:hypothetical protein
MRMNAKYTPAAAAETRQTTMAVDGEEVGGKTRTKMHGVGSDVRRQDNKYHLYAWHAGPTGTRTTE